MTPIVYPPSTEIMYLKGELNYTEIYLKDGSRLVFSTTLKRHQEKLSGFLRVSKSHLLNPLFISSVESKGRRKEIILATGYRVKVSRRRKRAVIDFSFMYLSD